jgi:hypothetical protein
MYVPLVVFGSLRRRTVSYSKLYVICNISSGSWNPLVSEYVECAAAGTGMMLAQ